VNNSPHDPIGRLQDLDPRTIEAAIREAHRLRARTACALFSAAGAGMARLWRAATRGLLAQAPGRRTRVQAR